MYEKIEKLVQEDKLFFACDHRLNVKHYLEKNKKRFLEDVEMSMDMYAYQFKKEGTILHREYCFDCGERVSYRLEGESLVPIGTAECFTEKEFTVDIPVPSGELILDDWFEHATELLEHLDEKTDDINNKKTRVMRMKDYAAERIVHFHVGNSSPTVYQKGSMLLIGRDSYDEDDNEIRLDKEAKDVGYVCTDLWWVSICDKSVYEKIAIEKFGEEKGKKMTDTATKNADVTLQVEPGIYRLHYFTNIHENHELYATLTKIEKGE